MHLEEHNRCFMHFLASKEFLGPAFHASRLRKMKKMKSVNLAWAVRISGEGGQEGRHLAKKKKGLRV